eukprot:403343108
MALNNQTPTKYSIIIVKGDIFRQRADDGKTGFIFNEMPRLVIDEVQEKIIGNPVALYKACQQNKYDDLANKYEQDYFKIPYHPQFIERYITKVNPPVSNREISLQLVDKISDLQPKDYKNKVLFPRIPDTNISFIILSYGFYLHKAKTLLKRLSRVAFNMGTCADDSTAQFDRLIKKVVHIPISSNQTLAICSYQFEKHYLVRDRVPYLNSDHQDVYSIRTLSQINNLSTNLKNLRILHHPHLFSGALPKEQIQEVKNLLQNDQLEELSFDMKLENSEYATIFTLIKQQSRLRKLLLNVSVKPEIIDVLNKGINKDNNFKQLSVNFQAGESFFEVKFHKYLKNLKSLSLTNVGDKNFTESMFDMACIRKLRELSLSFIPDLSLPSFSEALSKFSQLQSLQISSIPYHKIKQQIFLEYIANGAINLRSLSLDNLALSDDQFKLILASVSQNKSLRHLKLTSIHMDSDKKLGFFTGFIGCKQTTLASITLADNYLQNLDILEQMHFNQHLKELTIMTQTYFRNSSTLTEDQFKDIKPNKFVQKYVMGLGVIKTIKPLIIALNTFPNLRDLRIQNVELTNLHFKVIDNYLIQNPDLQKLTLMNVKMGYDQFFILEGTIRNSKKLRKLNLSGNQLRNQGCTEVANIMMSNSSIQSLSLDNNDIKEHGLVAILKVLETNKTLVKIRMENNKFMISRQLLGQIGNLFVFSNRTLQQFVITYHGQCLLKKDSMEGSGSDSEYDRDMIIRFTQEIQNKTNLKLFSI